MRLEGSGLLLAVLQPFRGQVIQNRPSRRKGMKHKIILGLSVVLLLFVGARLIVLIRGELGRLEGGRSLAASVHKTGSLHGVGPGGIVGSGALGLKYRVLFVVHLSSLDGDLKYWNAVRKAVGPQTSDIDWWGICDSGSACDAFQGAARFSVVGFMDPYQMRVLSNADVTSRVLLYENAILFGAVERAATSTKMAEALVKALPRP